MSSIWYLLPLVVLHTGLSSIIDHTAKHQCTLFGRIACLSEAIPTNQGLCCHIDESLDQPPQSMWKCRPRCWCNSWIEQIRQDSGFSSAELWHSKKSREEYGSYWNPSQSYRMSLAIWEHTVLPATRQKWTHPAQTPARVRYSIYVPQRDGRLSWPRWPVATKIVYPPIDGHPSKY